MNNRIADTKKALIDYINSLEITDGEYGNYDIIMNLLNNADDALFTKIIEEIKDNNLKFSDFVEWFGKDDFFTKSIDEQQKIFIEGKLLSDIKAKINEIRVDKSNLQVMKSDEAIQTATKIEKRNTLLSLIDSQSDSYIEKLYKAKMIELILRSDTDAIDSMLLSLNEYIVPVDFDHIILNEYDKKFAKENNITEDDVRKLKSFAALLLNQEQVPPTE